MIEFVTEYIKKGKNDTLQEYLSNGGFQGLEAALSRSSLEVIEEIEKSGLCGRGGAYFPAGIKWQSLKDADCKESGEKYIVCNADEGEPGTFKDRYLLENCCWQVFEGMLIAAYATGAKKGYIYLRGEYRYLTLGTSLAVLREHQLLGNKIMDTDFSFEIEIRSGAGAYICGEESALLNSLQGERGVTRNKAPLPIRKGLWGQPTLIHNVETLATVVQIMKYGADFFREVGDSSALPGSKLVCFSGAFQNTGVYEVPMGIKLTDLIYRVCGGDGRIRYAGVRIRAVIGASFRPAADRSVPARGGFLEKFGNAAFDVVHDFLPAFFFFEMVV